MSANLGLNRLGTVFKALAVLWLLMWASVLVYGFVTNTNEAGTFIVTGALAGIPAAIVWVIGWVIQGFAD